jgi:glyoxylase-like metal-dependent hydrolase (beta-lactamase superfamily II)
MYGGKLQCLLISDRSLLRLLFLSLVVLLAAGVLIAQSHERQVAKLAEGVNEIQHKSIPAGDSGNTTVIIGDREVFVVDSGYFPSVAREDIAQIRQWTNKPVAYVLNTHFHNDHNNGNRTYVDAFPSVAIVAQEETKKDMDLRLQSTRNWWGWAYVT